MISGSLLKFPFRKNLIGRMNDLFDSGLSIVKWIVSCVAGISLKPTPDLNLLLWSYLFLSFAWTVYIRVPVGTVSLEFSFGHYLILWLLVRLTS